MADIKIVLQNYYNKLVWLYKSSRCILFDFV